MHGAERAVAHGIRIDEVEGRRGLAQAAGAAPRAFAAGERARPIGGGAAAPRVGGRGERGALRAVEPLRREIVEGSCDVAEGRAALRTVKLRRDDRVSP